PRAFHRSLDRLVVARIARALRQTNVRDLSGVEDAEPHRDAQVTAVPDVGPALLNLGDHLIVVDHELEAAHRAAAARSLAADPGRPVQGALGAALPAARPGAGEPGRAGLADPRLDALDRRGKQVVDAARGRW